MSNNMKENKFLSSFKYVSLILISMFLIWNLSFLIKTAVLGFIIFLVVLEVLYVKSKNIKYNKTKNSFGRY